LDLLVGRLPGDLFYHHLEHTRDDVLPATERLARAVGLDGEGRALLRLAALYHDVGYVERYFRNEALGARMAAEALTACGLRAAQIRTVQRLIMATQLPQTPRDLLEAILCDADLDSLGREDFLRTSHALRRELGAHGTEIPLKVWYERQLNFLEQHTYFTRAARALRQAGKRKNIERLRARIARR
jgi:uncharacterized protein